MVVVGGPHESTVFVGVERGGLWEEIVGLYGFCGDRRCVSSDLFASEKLGGGRVTKSTRNVDMFDKETEAKMQNLQLNTREGLVCPRGDFSPEVSQKIWFESQDHCPLHTCTFK